MPDLFYFNRHFHSMQAEHATIMETEKQKIVSKQRT